MNINRKKIKRIKRINSGKKKVEEKRKNDGNSAFEVSTTEDFLPPTGISNTLCDL